PFGYNLPESGTPVITEGIAIIDDAPHPEAAEAFYALVGKLYLVYLKGSSKGKDFVFSCVINRSFRAENLIKYNTLYLFHKCVLYEWRAEFVNTPEAAQLLAERYYRIPTRDDIEELPDWIEET